MAVTRGLWSVKRVNKEKRMTFKGEMEMADSKVSSQE
jgi:hypothetical protein